MEEYDYNLQLSNSAWGPNGACFDTDQWSHSRNRGIVLNQITQPAEYDISDSVTGCGAEENVPAKQTITFQFFREVNGQKVAFDPINFKISIYDITSVNRNPIWRTQYKDAVGFSLKPDAITTISGPYPQGIGEGTLSSPYQRAEGQNPTMPGNDQLDSFSFAKFPSGTTMEYSNLWGFGRQFILIDSISFDGDC